MQTHTNYDVVMEQYKTQDNLVARMNLHQKYDRNKKWTHWLFENYHFFQGCRVLELGCGTGCIWEEQIDTLPDDINIELTDLSIRKQNTSR